MDKKEREQSSLIALFFLYLADIRNNPIYSKNSRNYVENGITTPFLTLPPRGGGNGRGGIFIARGWPSSHWKLLRKEILLLKFQKDKPILSIQDDCGVSLSGAALTDLLRAVVSQGSLFTLQAKGWSMSPFIREGDVVTISPLHGALPGVGDVVAFIHPAIKRAFIHRIIGKKGDSYIMKGDNSLEMDGPVPEANILGLVKRVDRDDKRITLGLGLERYLIAFLTRRNLLRSLITPLQRIIHPLRSTNT